MQTASPPGGIPPPLLLPIPTLPFSLRDASLFLAPIFQSVCARGTSPCTEPEARAVLQAKQYTETITNTSPTPSLVFFSELKQNKQNKQTPPPPTTTQRRIVEPFSPPRTVVCRSKGNEGRLCLLLRGGMDEPNPPKSTSSSSLSLSHPPPRLPKRTTDSIYE